MDLGMEVVNGIGENYDVLGVDKGLEFKNVLWFIEFVFIIYDYNVYGNVIKYFYFNNSM